MSVTDPTVVGVEWGDLTTRYPRTVGRNARLGEHGYGPTARVAVLRTDDGRAGWGLVEGAPRDATTLTGRTVSELLGPDGVRDPGNRAFDVPLHDLLGVVTDTPVAALLGGAPAAVPVYDGAIYFDDLDPEAQPRGVAQLLRECHDDARLGHTGFKLKIGRGNRWMGTAEGDRRDAEVILAVREEFPDAALLVDANDGYDVERMCRLLERVAGAGLFWIEEPFADDAAGLAVLRAELDRVSPETRIADGERDPDVDALMPIAAAGDLQVLLMDVCSFGISAWRQAMPQLIEAGAEASPHAWGQPLKTLYAAHVAAGLGRVPMVEGVPGVTQGVDENLLRIVDGHLRLSDRPGFGLPVPDLSARATH